MSTQNGVFRAHAPKRKQNRWIVARQTQMFLSSKETFVQKRPHGPSECLNEKKKWSEKRALVLFRWSQQQFYRSFFVPVSTLVHSLKAFSWTLFFAQGLLLSQCCRFLVQKKATTAVGFPYRQQSGGDFCKKAKSVALKKSSRKNSQKRWKKLQSKKSRRIFACTFCDRCTRLAPSGMKKVSQQLWLTEWQRQPFSLHHWMERPTTSYLYIYRYIFLQYTYEHFRPTSMYDNLQAEMTKKNTKNDYSLLGTDKHGVQNITCLQSVNSSLAYFFSYFLKSMINKREKKEKKKLCYCEWI